jgi:hypothetical protein
VTRRRPLAWYLTDAGDTPDCGPCLEHLFTAPHLREAVASVSIEHPMSAAELTRQYIETFHTNNHEEHP